jgi:hypothetical protein
VSDTARERAEPVYARTVMDVLSELPVEQLEAMRALLEKWLGAKRIEIQQIEEALARAGVPVAEEET